MSEDNICLHWIDDGDLCVMWHPPLWILAAVVQEFDRAWVTA